MAVNRESFTDPKDSHAVARRKKTARISLKDIADELGISTTAASFALNDKPGVSQETKKRVKAAASRLGWSPVYAAQALSSSRTMTIGFSPAQARTNFQNESFMLHFMAGIHSSLSRRRYGLLFRPSTSLDEEIEIYNDWASRKRVDGVVLTDLRTDDPRPRVLKKLGIPAVLAGGPDPGDYVPSLSIDDSGTMEAILQHLVDMGHRSVAYLSGDVNLEYSRIRARVFEDFAHKNDFTSAKVNYTNFDPDIASALTCSMLSSSDAPTALIYENETMASSSLRALEKLYYSGADISEGKSSSTVSYLEALPAIVSFEDAYVCTATYPSITAIHRDPMEYGQKVANLLIKKLSGDEVTGNRQILPAKLIERESTAQPPTAV